MNTERPAAAGGLPFAAIWFALGEIVGMLFVLLGWVIGRAL